ncbi:hypothetical protein U0070_004035 [Myodes glareolus]|uniref:Uncharacterized protein n=1 Tax=Myodes glareolus TaxID=447135 RepID=A0AAW0KA86_MYOGA
MSETNTKQMKQITISGPDINMSFSHGLHFLTMECILSKAFVPAVMVLSENQEDIKNWRKSGGDGIKRRPGRWKARGERKGPSAGSLGTRLGCVGRGVGLEGQRSPRPSGFAPRPRGSGGEKPARRSQSDRWARGQPRAGGFREAPPRVLRAAVVPPPSAWRPSRSSERSARVAQAQSGGEVRRFPRRLFRQRRRRQSWEEEVEAGGKPALGAAAGGGSEFPRGSMT